MPLFKVKYQIDAEVMLTADNQAQAEERAEEILVGRLLVEGPIGVHKSPIIDDSRVLDVELIDASKEDA